MFTDACITAFMQAWRAQVLTLALHTSNRICLCCHGASLLFRWPALRGRAQWPAQPVTRPRLHPKAAAAPALAIRGSFRHALPLVLSQSYYCALFMRSRAWCTVGRFVGAPLAASNSASRVRTNYRMPLCTVLRGIRIAFASAPPPHPDSALSFKIPVHNPTIPSLQNPSLFRKDARSHPSCGGGQSKAAFHSLCPHSSACVSI